MPEGYYTGAEGWRHPAWRGNFYPDDLPEDWLLSYYNTQFQAVYLPAACWQAATAEQWADWLNDTLPRFVFLLEPGSASPPDNPRIIVAAPDWAAAHVWWLDDAPDLRALAQSAIDRAARGEAFFVISRQGNLALLEQADTLRQMLGC